MAKAHILEFFAWVNLVVGSLFAAYFIIQGAQEPIGGTYTVLIGLGIFFGSLLQFGVLGGLGEIVSRLVKIDENTQQPMLPPPEIPLRDYSKIPNPPKPGAELAKPAAASTSESLPAIGRAGRGQES